MLVRSKQFFQSSWGRTYLVTLFFVTLAAFLFWLDFFRVYESETTLLFVGNGSQETREVAGSLADIAETLSFYNRVLEQDETLDDPAAGKQPDKRKDYWQSVMRSESGSEGSTLRLTVSQSNAADAQDLSKAVLKALLQTASLYYDIEKDVKVRVIDGPITGPKIAQPALLAAVAFVTSLAVTSIFFGILSFLGGAAPRRGPQSEFVPVYKEALPKKSEGKLPVGESVPWINPDKFVPVRPAGLSFENTEGALPQAAGPRVSFQKKSSAPSNLPILDEEAWSSMFASGEPSSEEPESEEEPETAPEPAIGPDQLYKKDVSEPTIEEYKRRLNELLRGNPIK